VDARSLLTTADLDLLSRWLVHPCGADDLEAFPARSEQGAAALRAVALPAGTTVWQDHLQRVGDRHLLAADAPGVRAGVLCLGGLRAALNHARQAYSRRGVSMYGAARTRRSSVGGDMIRLASGTSTSITRYEPRVGVEIVGDPEA
jgi:hypothetical protein